MKEIIIAFDVDGTILNNEGIPPGTETHLRPKTSVNLDIVMLMQILSNMRNTKIIVWSGGGKDHAEDTVRIYGLEKYVHRCYAKHMYDETIDGEVDIAFDDITTFELGDKNLILKNNIL